MTTTEFSNEFDTLINSYKQTLPYGTNQNIFTFDEYEKSVFLTKALEDIVVGLYTGNASGDSFELTELLRRYLANLENTEYLTPYLATFSIDLNTQEVILPPDVWFITHEAALFEPNGKYIEVIPVAQDDYHRLKNNPFKRPSDKRVFRLDRLDKSLELIATKPVTQYIVRYLAKPHPIILTNLEGELTINNQSEITECELHSALHRNILELAVSMAIKSRSTNSNK